MQTETEYTSRDSVQSSEDAPDSKAMKFGELLELYNEAKSVDKEATAEMRNNILLIAGEHWTKRMNDFFSRSAATQVEDSNKLKITKNNIHRAHRLYMSSISSLAPGATISPRNPLELQDRKDAELYQAVWEYIKSHYKLKAHFRESLSDFIGIGECATVIKFDPTLGDTKGYEAQVDEMGQPVVDEMGHPVADESKPVMKGEFVFSRRYGQNIFRDPSAQQMKDAKWIGFEILESTKNLKRQYKEQPEKLRMITESTEDYLVFDSNRGGYNKQKDQTVVKEIFYKKCHEYPKGYFYIFTKTGILEHGELPGGVWPVLWQGFDEHATKCRATGIVKVARPYQLELNRSSSAVALHQITVSADKLLYQAGSKLTAGSLIPGVRGIEYNGTPPTILPGRSGEQFYEYIDRQYAEMDRALMIDQLDAEKMNNLDPYSLMFRSMSSTAKFSVYAEKFGEFLISFCETVGELSKIYLPDDELVAAIGKAEAINIAEFRKVEPLHYRIHVEEQQDTIESKLGKQLMISQIMQYSSSQLSREDIGKLITQMPYGNWQKIFADFTIDERNTENDFLAIERGEKPYISPNDKSDYVLTQLASRKKERDYQTLAPAIQQMYDQYEQIHLQKKDQEAQSLKQAKSELIQTGGAMIACDMYVPAEDPTKAPKRVRVPYQSLEWLLKTLEQQGSTLQSMEQMNSGQLAELARMQQGGQQQAQESAGAF